jgi:hypothetical protein
MTRIDLIVLRSPANRFRVLSDKPSSIPMHRLIHIATKHRLTATKTQERRKDADDSKLSHNNSTTRGSWRRVCTLCVSHLPRQLGPTHSRGLHGDAPPSARRSSVFSSHAKRRRDDIWATRIRIPTHGVYAYPTNYVYDIDYAS